MPQTNWKDIAELIGIAAIVASLIFVGLQMRQTHQIALSQAYQSRADLAANVSMAVMQSPETLSGAAKARAGEVDSMSGEETIAVCQWMLATMHSFENSYFQYRDEFLPEGHWRRIREMIKNGYRSDPVTSLCTDRLLPRARIEFVREVEEIRREIESESSVK